MTRSIVSLVLFVAGCLLAGAIGGFATASSVKGWFVEVNKPSWNPPDAVFGPVWTTLYVMMGVAAWLVWRARDGADVRPAMTLFAVQLVLNILWSVIFFGMRQPGWAACEIVLLWLAIVATIVAFARVSTVAAGLLVPYLLWVSFATALNVAIWRLNS